eukprot:1706196-Prymnesium_polylepis.2
MFELERGSSLDARGAVWRWFSWACVSACARRERSRGRVRSLPALRPACLRRPTHVARRDRRIASVRFGRTFSAR